MLRAGLGLEIFSLGFAKPGPNPTRLGEWSGLGWTEKYFAGWKKYHPLFMILFFLYLRTLLWKYYVYNEFRLNMWSLYLHVFSRNWGWWFLWRYIPIFLSCHVVVYSLQNLDTKLLKKTIGLYTLLLIKWPIDIFVLQIWDLSNHVVITFCHL